MSELVVTLEELSLLLSEGEATCEKCQDGFLPALDIYRIEWNPDRFELIILCGDCAGVLYRFLTRLRGGIP